MMKIFDFAREVCTVQLHLDLLGGPCIILSKTSTCIMQVFVPRAPVAHSYEVTLARRCEKCEP